MRLKRIFFIFLSLYSVLLSGQGKFDYQWIIGRSNGLVKGAIIDFNDDTMKVSSVDKSMDIETTLTSICDENGSLLAYTNGCFIADGSHQLINNGDSIGGGYLETSFCNTGGAPINQGGIILPSPNNSNFFYLFHLDMGSPYASNPLFFPLAPVNFFYSTIFIDKMTGTSEIVEKKIPLLQDTFARGGIQATRHSDGSRWWVVVPESHSNCYITFLVDSNGVSSLSKQCIGKVWNDKDSQGQTVFSPDSKKYVRCNYYNGLNIFDFNNTTGILSNPNYIDFGLDTFNFNGAAFSSNSRILYIPAYDKLFQLDIHSTEIGLGKQIVAELSAPPNLQFKTFFNKALLAPNGKIYIGGTSQFNYFHVIEAPNCLGASCKIKQYAVELPVFCSFSMPNLPSYHFNNDSSNCEVVIKSTRNIKNKRLALYPNPALDEIMISTNNSNFEYEYIIYSLEGKKYKEGICSSGKAISLEKFPSGIYFIHCVAGFQSYVEPFIKL